MNGDGVAEWLTRWTCDLMVQGSIPLLYFTLKYLFPLFCNAKPNSLEIRLNKL